MGSLEPCAPPAGLRSSKSARLASGRPRPRAPVPAHRPRARPSSAWPTHPTSCLDSPVLTLPSCSSCMRSWCQRPSRESARAAAPSPRRYAAVAAWNSLLRCSAWSIASCRSRLYSCDTAAPVSTHRLGCGVAAPHRYRPPAGDRRDGVAAVGRVSERGAAAKSTGRGKSARTCSVAAATSPSVRSSASRRNSGGTHGNASCRRAMRPTRAYGSGVGALAASRSDSAGNMAESWASRASSAAAKAASSSSVSPAFWSAPLATAAACRNSQLSPLTQRPCSQKRHTVAPTSCENGQSARRHSPARKCRHTGWSSAAARVAAAPS